MHRGRTVLFAGLGLAVLIGLAWLGAALAGEPAPPAVVDPRAVIAGAVAAGRHVRIDGPRGPIHVWIPASYHADTGATVVYVHGYFDDADTAWTGHQLAQQFALSALNALFVVPEAPVAQKTPINYPDLGELLRLVEDASGVARGAGLTVAVGHSGAFRTLQTWFDEPLLDQVVMVDAMYGDEDAVVGWLRASPRHRLIFVGEDTLLATESVADKLPGTVTVNWFPPTYDTWPAAARTARSVYVRAQYAHMPLVTEGIVLPSLLRLLPVELLADEPWRLPMGSLPPLPSATADAAVNAAPEAGADPADAAAE
ncbi:MAG TPA: hypothetical protein VHW23_19545 [Kofleriaceae bacterium]|nr:hypothetical protein [Kofleriaceae bacterium]